MFVFSNKKHATSIKVFPMRITTIVIFVALMFSAVFSHAANYYVSSTGSDTNAGSSLSSPFLTIGKAASMATAGDTVYVRGGTYRETVTVANSGTEAAPIRFRTYGNECVTVTGLDKVSSGWSTVSGSTYQNTVSGGASQLFVNNKMMIEARSTNSGYINPLRRTYNTVTSASIHNPPTDSTITSNDIGNPSDGTWAGAKMAVLGGEGWATFTSSVKSQTGNTLAFQWTTENHTAYNPKTCNSFYLYNSVAAVDSNNEYYYDASSSKLYFNSSVNPNSQIVEIRKRQLGFDLGGNSYVNVDGFRLKAATIEVNGSHNKINNCQILYPKEFTDDGGMVTTTAGVKVTGQYNTISNSEIGYSWGSGISLEGTGASNNTIANNVIHDVNWFANGVAGVEIARSGSGNTVTNNTVYNCGRCGIEHTSAAGATITHNDISRYGFLTKDVGGTYCWSTDGAGTTIAYNKIHDCRDTGYNGQGVYMDNNSSNITVHHNLITNVQRGICLADTSTNENVYNNTLWNVTTSMTGNGHTNCSTYNNLSNEGTFLGTSTGTNIGTATSADFANTAAGNYTLTSTSSAINAGTTISGITEGYVGSAPDVGAFEYGATAWTAGANFRTWLAGNQVAATLTAAVSVKYGGTPTSGTLIVGRTSTTAPSNSRSFLKFDVSDVTGKIGSAVLRLYENAQTSAVGGVSLYTIKSTWSPDTVSYGQGVKATGISFYDPDNLDFYTEIDVTSIVQGWINDPSSNYGFSLRNDSESTNDLAKYFEGMYGITAPQLIITVPEPGAMSLLFTAALAGLGAMAWRGRKAADSRM